jgi:hypothetical protein
MSQQGTRQETSEAREALADGARVSLRQTSARTRRRDRPSADPTVNACAFRESLLGAKATPGGGWGMTGRSGMPVGGMPRSGSLGAGA